MRVPLEWLADYVELSLPVEELAHRLTMSGLKVEAIERIGADWDGILVGQVVEIGPHPTSRKPLQVARVDLAHRIITLVTGAPNVSPGDKVPVVLVGGHVPHGPDGGPMLIEARRMAGIDSEGMMASARELGISDDHSGIFILPSDAPVGAALRSLLGDDVLVIETNPNRADTLSMIGVAREVAALTGQQVTLPDLDTLGGEVEWTREPSIAVDVRAPDLCPRYSALRLQGLPSMPSPAWMQERLRHAGQRPINLLVDITNYVMLEYGQPMHAFDARRLAGNRIVVRRAGAGETMRTLDGNERTLGPSNLVIADAERAVAIAGVMGGANSEVGPTTGEIVIESATFDAVSVRRTAQALGLRTEASARFEKDLPPETTVLGLKRALQLLVDIVDGPLRVSQVSDVWIGSVPSPVVTMPMRDLHRLVGLPISRERAAETLSLLGFTVEEQDASIVAGVPYWRRADVTRSADLVEEVARLVGFDAIPVTLPRATMPPATLPPGLEWEGIVRDRLLAIGLSEAVTHSLTSPEAMARLARPGAACDDWAGLVVNPAAIAAREARVEPVRLANPASRDRRIMRLLLLPSLLDVIARNLKHSDQHVALFEIARTFFWRSENDLPYERRTLALTLAGTRRPTTWNDRQPGPFTFFDGKGVLEALIEALHIRDCSVEAVDHPALHPGRAAVVRLAGRDVAWFGELHPRVASAFDLESQRVQVAEVDLDGLIEHASQDRVFRPLPRFPAVFRDLAVVVDREVPAATVLRTIDRAAGDLLSEVNIFDLYTGNQLPPDRKSIAVSMSFRAPGATLTQDEVGAEVDRILDRLQVELAATIRA